MNMRALITNTVIGAALQVAMIVAGQYLPAVQAYYPIAGTLISLVAGLLYARAARGGWGDSLVGGAITGAVCALIGIAMSWALGQVPPITFLIGTSASAVGGLIGGAVGKVIAK
jgi:hypothetical protein